MTAFRIQTLVLSGHVWPQKVAEITRMQSCSAITDSKLVIMHFHTSPTAKQCQCREMPASILMFSSCYDDKKVCYHISTLLHSGAFFVVISVHNIQSVS